MPKLVSRNWSWNKTRLLIECLDKCNEIPFSKGPTLVVFNNFHRKESNKTIKTQGGLVVRMNVKKKIKMKGKWSKIISYVFMQDAPHQIDII